MDPRSWENNSGKKGNEGTICHNWKFGEKRERKEMRKRRKRDEDEKEKKKDEDERGSLGQVPENWNTRNFSGSLSL